MSDPADSPQKPSEAGFLSKASLWLAGLVSLIGVLTLLLGGIPKLVEASKSAYCSVASCSKPAAYGPATCRVGFVWREAYTNDVVCVTPQTRDAVAKDNAAAATRAKSDGTCNPGFVWRQARSSDHICVTPQTRSDTLADNAAASSRVQPP